MVTKALQEIFNVATSLLFFFCRRQVFKGLSHSRCLHAHSPLLLMKRSSSCQMSPACLLLKATCRTCLLASHLSINGLFIAARGASPNRQLCGVVERHQNVEL